MAIFNDSVYSKVREKINKYDLSEQEIKAIDTAKGQLQTRTRVGALAGASIAFLLGRYKKFNAFQILAVTGGGFLMGSQMGIVSGALAGIKTINTLPDPQRLINIIKEVQMDVIKGKQSSTIPSVRAAPLSQRELDQAQNPQDQFSSEKANYAVEHDKGQWDLRQPQKDYSISSQLEPSARQSIQTSAWDKIRSENLPSSTWSRIRAEAQQNPNNNNAQQIAKARTERANKLRELSDQPNEELPRTREEGMLRGGGQRNKWGDPLD